MQTLSNTQRDYLRKTAHDLRPVVQVGKQGMTEPVLKAIETALIAHELIKVKFIEHKEERRELAENMCLQVGCTLVKLIGNVAIIYRAHPELKKRKILLPAS